MAIRQVPGRATLVGIDPRSANPAALGPGKLTRVLLERPQPAARAAHHGLMHDVVAFAERVLGPRPSAAPAKASDPIAAKVEAWRTQIK